ncbi:HEAT repeat domain-containing protein [Nocardia brasiliensis]
MTTTDDAAAAELLEEYRQAGGYGQTIPDIPNSVSLTPAAVEVVAQWLSELERRWPGPETEGRELARLSLANALGRKEARKTSAVPALISQFDIAKAMSARTRWAAGNSIYEIPAGIDYFDQLADIASNRAFGADRQMVVGWLGKSRHPRAVEVALAQLDDTDVQGHALEALAKLRPQGVREQIEPFLTSKNKWHRRTAERIARYDES